MKRTRIKPVSDRRRRRDANYHDQRKRVWERADGRCEWAEDGRRCPSPMTDCHHRAGRLGSDPHRLGNLVGLCAPHHRQAHADKPRAIELGISASRHGGAA